MLHLHRHTGPEGRASGGLLGREFVRYALVVVIEWIGARKYSSYEATASHPLVASSPIYELALQHLQRAHHAPSRHRACRDNGTRRHDQRDNGTNTATLCGRSGHPASCTAA
jgi:uncharacterized membrane protein YkgB